MKTKLPKEWEDWFLHLISIKDEILKTKSEMEKINSVNYLIGYISSIDFLKLKFKKDLK